MINLIPPDAKKAVVKEYWLRVAVVWLFLLAISLIIVGVFKLPSYVLLQAQEIAFEEQFESAAENQAEFEQSEALIKQANLEAKHLNSFATTVPFSEYMDTLDSLATAGVSISNFSFKKNDGVLEEILITGTAADRKSLTQFKDVISENESFANAELPISNLAQDLDIRFSITVIPSEE